MYQKAYEMSDARGYQLLKEWANRSCVHIGKQVRLKKHKMPYYDATLRPYDDNAEAVYRSIMTEEVDAIEVTVSIDELTRLLKDQEKLRHLLYLPEVRQAMFYYSLSGEFDV